MRIAPFAVLLLIGVGSAASAAAQVDCEPARCQVQAAIDAECPCDDASNHGRHVSCVAHVVNRLSKQGGIPTNCKGKIKRCAARSVCGKPGAVTCQVPEYGICDTTTGLCAHDQLTPCTDSTQCITGSRCKVKRDAERCTEIGGTVGAGTTCCSSCVAPVP